MKTSVRVVFVVLIASLPWISFPASARDAQAQAITPDSPTATHTYDGFVAQAPASGVVEAAYTPEACLTAEYCDTINLDIRVPSNYQYRWSLKVTVSWIGLTDQEDMDAWLFDRFNDNLSGPQAATASSPETMIVSNLDPDLYYIVVLNYQGAQESYEVKSEFLQGSKIQKKSSPSPEPLTHSTPRTTSAPIPLAASSPDSFESHPPPPVIDSGTTKSSPLPSILGTGKAVAFSNLKWSGRKVGIGLAAMIALAIGAYFLLFAPRKERAGPPVMDKG